MSSSKAGAVGGDFQPVGGSAFAVPGAREPGRHAWSRLIAVDLVGFMDVAGIIFGGLLPAWIYAAFGGVAIHWPGATQACLLVALFSYLCLRHFGLYDVSRVHDLPLSPARITLAIGIGFSTVFGLAMPFGLTNPNFWVWYGTWACTALAIVLGGRMCARAILLRMARAGLFDARVAIYGGGSVSDRVIGYLADPALAVRVVGVYDDRQPGRAAGWHKHVKAIPIQGSLAELIELGRTGEIDQIIIALPQSSDQRIAEVARRLEQLPVSLHVCTHFMSDLVEETAAHAHGVSRVGPIGLIDIKTKPLSDWGRYVKTVEDYIIGAIALAVVAPLMALIAIAVKLDSPGPVLFRQRRHGLNRRVIEVLKFRSMRVMEDGAHVVQATAGDPRVTRLGRFLRASSLDELPQLVNVLRGEMSLIGPRPHALVHDDQYGEMLERYANRHQVKPGMTGWAQVKGFRGPTETPAKMQARVEADLFYIDNWSLWLDLKILTLTVFVGLRHKNAL